MFTGYKYSFTEFILFTPGLFNENRLRKELSGKTILITGASFGIGESLAYRLAHAGAHVILVARTEEKLISIQNKIISENGKASTFPADLTKPGQIEALLHFLHTLPGGVDIVINNAGKSIRRSMHDSLDRYHDFTRTMALNYFGPVQLLLSLIPGLEKNKGHIINISTVAVLLAPAPKWAAYLASKAAFDNWLRCASPELNAAGVYTSSIYLPLVKTRMIAPTQAYRHMPAMHPDHVAAIICNVMISKNRKYAPWWLIFGQLGSIIFRRPWEIANTYLLKEKPPKTVNPTA